MTNPAIIAGERRTDEANLDSTHQLMASETAPVIRTASPPPST